MGVYILVTSHAKSTDYTAQYVGMTSKQGFQNEAFGVYQKGIYNKYLGGYEKITAKMFFIAKKTNKNKWSKQKEDKEIKFLEDFYMMLSMMINKDLLNTRGVATMRNLVVPGFYNGGQGKFPDGFKLHDMFFD